MTSLLQHQADEVEALQSIFTDTDIQVNGTDVNILLLPSPGLPMDSSENQVAIGLRLSVPPEYPAEAPVEVFITSKKNIDGARENAIKAIIEDTLSSNAGFEVLFDLYSRITEWLQANNEPLRSLFDTVAKNQTGGSPCTGPGGGLRDDYGSDEEDDDDSVSSHSSAGRLADKDLVAEDHRVTEEQFQKWRHAFRFEMITAGIWKDEDLIDSRPTGKDIFLRVRGLEGAAGTPTEGAGGTATEGAPSSSAAKDQVFWKDEALFDDDVDLEDIES